MVYSVGLLTRYIGSLFSSDFRLNNLSVSGEVSNITYHGSGHIYFTIKDDTAQMKAIMFRSDREGLSFPMKSGDKVVCKGSVKLYEKGGYHQLYVNSIEPAGQGKLYLEFLKLKEELLESGMFDEGYKKPIPRFSGKVGIVTAPTGAAIKDIIRISKRRNPFVEIILYPALVQGDEAPASIVRGIETLDASDVDVIIVGRGGGSIEDLWAFNDRGVAEAIFACSKPVVSAVGHETDFTIADFVADKRAATPSEAAELTVYEDEALRDLLADYKRRIDTIINDNILQKREYLEQIEKRLSLLSPQSQLREKRTRLVEIEERLSIGINSVIRDKRNIINGLAGRLEGLSPVKRLAQGYSFLSDDAGNVITDSAHLKENDIIMARLYKGKVKACITDILE